MNSNLIMKSDVLDIVFENRNKAYGAYELRKFYPNRIKVAVWLMLIIAIVFSALTLLPTKTRETVSMIYDITEPELKAVEIKPNEPVKKPELEKSLAKDITPASEKRYINNLQIVPNEEETDTISTLLATDVIGTKNIISDKPALILVQPVKTGTGTGEPEIITPKIDKTIPMDIGKVDYPPTYPGGMEALRKFLERNLHNPKDMEEGESVSVRIKFVVNYNGKLQSFVTVQDGGEEFNREVVRVLKKMPDWVPGKAKGENVSVYYTIPVKFVSAY